jgi:hypothetical protein
MRKVRYIIHPGNIISRKDGDEHFVGAKQLANLYGVNLAECIVADGVRDRGLDAGDYIHLGPRFDGEYKESLNELLKKL